MKLEKNWWGRGIGWKDLGKVKSYTELVDGEIYNIKQTCSRCRSRVRLAKGKDEEVFLYCPLCMVILK